MRNWLNARSEAKRATERLYAAIVAQSRLPAFYADLGVPDTPTGRFEMIVLHMFMVLERLGPSAERLSQTLTEAFVADVEGALREMGIADITVPKRMHAMAGAFFGRMLAYREAAAEHGDALAQAIARNVFADAGAERPTDGPARLAAYVRDSVVTLADCPDATLRGGASTFGTVPVTSPISSSLISKAEVRP